MQKNHNKPHRIPLAKKTLGYLITPAVIYMICTATLVCSLLLFQQAASHERKAKKLNQGASKQVPLSISSEIRSGDVTILVDNLRYEDGKKPFIAPNGKKYLILDFTIKNRSDSPKSILPASDTYIKDSAGNVYYLSPYVIQNPFL